MSRLSPRFFVVGALTALVLSCGIPQPTYIGPAENVTYQTVPPTVSFDHNRTDNSSEDFLGYELYYKFYAYSPTPEDGQFGNDYTTISGGAPGTGLATVTNSGFQRVAQAVDGGGIAPLIVITPAEADTDFTVSLSFPDRPSQLNPAPAQANFLSQTLLLTRTPIATAIGEPFDSDALSTDPPDPDIPLGIPATDDLIQMAIVILAYGRDNTGNTFTTIYSDPRIIDEPLVLSLR